MSLSSTPNQPISLAHKIWLLNKWNVEIHLIFFTVLIGTIPLPPSSIKLDDPVFIDLIYDISVSNELAKANWSTTVRMKGRGASRSIEEQILLLFSFSWQTKAPIGIAINFYWRK